MSDDTRGESFLSRWSRRKIAAAREPREEASNASPGVAAGDVGTGAATTYPQEPDQDGHGVPRADGPRPPAEGAEAGQGTRGSARAPVSKPMQAASVDAARTLPPVESLTFDSDFTGFMAPGVDPAVRQAALRKLLHDPRFNVMDGLDVYIDDYTKPSPIAPAVVRQLAHARYLFDPPRTRINAHGQVEDVVADEPPAAAAGVEGAASAPATAGHCAPPRAIDADPTGERGGDPAQAGAVHAPAARPAGVEAPNASDGIPAQPDATRSRLPITGDLA